MSSPLWPTAASYRSNPVMLETTLEAEFSVAQLRELAKMLDVKLKGTSKSGYVGQVAAALQARSDNAQGEEILAGLTDEQADFVRRMLTARDADLPMPRMLAHTVWAKQFGANANAKLSEVLESLRRRALLFPTLSYYIHNVRDVFFQWLPLGKHTPVVKWQVTTQSKLANSTDTLPTPQPLLEMLDTFLNAAMQTGVQLRLPLKPHPKNRQLFWLQGWEHDADEAERVLNSRPGWVPDVNAGLSMPSLALSPFSTAGAERIENQTGLSGAQCEFFLALACALQLLQLPNPKDNVAEVNRTHVEEWFGLSDTERLQRTWLAWTEHVMPALEARNAVAAQNANARFVVLRAIGARNLTPNAMAAEWCALRRFVVRVLRGLPVGVWVDWAELRQQLYNFHAESAWTMASRQEWWFAPVADTRKRLDPHKSGEWQSTVGVVIEHILMDALAWFGALETQVNGANRLQGLRITDVGAWLFGKQTKDLPLAARPNSASASAKPIAWLDESTLLLTPSPERADFVSFVRTVAERGAQAFSFVFTAAAIERALAQGIGLEAVMQQFKKMQLPLSKNVQAQFQRIAKRFGRVRAYENVTVLELADDLALRELSVNTRLLNHVVFQLSPRAVVLREEGLEQLIEEIQEQGYIPKINVHSEK